MSEGFETPSRSSVAVNDASAGSPAQRDGTARSAAPRFELRAPIQAAAIESKARRLTGLAARLITAAIAIPVVALLTIAGGSWFAVLVLMVAALSAWELTALLRRSAIPATGLVTIAASWAFPLAAALQEPAVGTALLGLTIAGSLLALARTLHPPSAAGEQPTATAPDPPTVTLAGWGLSIAAGLYVGVLLAPSIDLREHPNGVWWVALVLGATWACDTAAYFVGRQWGSHKLAPTVSPQKSIEGTVAGLAAAVLFCLLGGTLMAETGVRVAGLGIVVAIGAVLGDLAESILKRHLAAKDSGWIMPGHGGLLDRIDSLILSGFFAYWYITLTDRIVAP
jgi:phosphatidate cytidylyltransferase